MLVDIIYLILIIIAVFKGYSRGLVVALFSIVGFIIGLAAALKLSAVVSSYLEGTTSIPSRWLPFISFAIVFLIVVIAVRMLAKVVETAFEMALLGWANKLAGIVIYIALYTIIYSVFLFYADKMKLIAATTIQQSVTYSFIQPFAPAVINGLGTVIPWFKDMFTELEDFFGKFSSSIK